MSKAIAKAEETATAAADRSKGGKLRGIPLDLESAVTNLDLPDNVIVRVEDMPVGARLSAGTGAAALLTADNDRDPGNVWSLRLSELHDLHLLTTATDPANYPLTIRVLLPDPDGYDYATTLAKFDLLVTDTGSVSAFSGLQGEERSKSDPSLLHLRSIISKGRKGETKSGKRALNLIDPNASRPPDEHRSTAVLQTLLDEEDRREAERKRMADAEADWLSREERRLAVAREDWEKETQQRVADSLAQAQVAETERLNIAEAKFKDRLAEQLAAAERRWQTRQLRQKKGDGGGKGADVEPAIDIEAIEAKLQAEF